MCGECSYSWLSVCHQLHSLSKISSFSETVFLSICLLGVRFGYFYGQDTWEFLYCGASLLVVLPSYLRFYGSLDETGPHWHIYIPGSHLVNCLEGLGCVALLEEVWPCCRRCGAGPELWGFKCQFQACRAGCGSQLLPQHHTCLLPCSPPWWLWANPWNCKQALRLNAFFYKGCLCHGVSSQKCNGDQDRLQKEQKQNVNKDTVQFSS